MTPDEADTVARYYRGAVVRWARSVAPASDAEDIAQDALTAFVAAAPALLPLASPSWLRTTVYRLARRHRTREVLADVPEIACPDPDPEDTLASREVAEQVQRALGKVPRSRREIVTRVHGEGLTIAAVAVADGIPESAARRRLADGTEDLRAAMTQERAKERRKSRGFTSWLASLGILDLRVWTRRSLAALGAATAGGVLVSLTVPVLPRTPDAAMVAPVVLVEDAPLLDTREPRETPRPAAVVVRERARHDAGRRFRAERFGER